MFEAKVFVNSRSFLKKIKSYKPKNHQKGITKAGQGIKTLHEGYLFLNLK